MGLGYTCGSGKYKSITDKDGVRIMTQQGNDTSKLDPKSNCKHDSPNQVQGEPCPLCGVMPTAEQWKGEGNKSKKMS
jgi:hypothetical protein